MISLDVADKGLGARRRDAFCGTGRLLLIMSSVPAVHLGHIHDDVDQVGAQLVGFHIDGRRVRRDVHLAVDVEQVGLFEPARCRDGVEEGFKGGKLRDESLHDFAEGFEDAVVVDGRAVVGDGGVFEAGVVEVVRDALADVSHCVVAEVFGQGVDFVDEDGVFDVWVGMLEVQDRFRETADGLHVIVYGIENPNHGADAAEDAFRVEIWV